MQDGARPLLRMGAIAGIAAIAAMLTTTRPAAANGRFPASSQLVFSPTDAGLLAVRTTFGLLVSHDDGVTWQWVCESVIGLGNAQEDPCFGITKTNAIVGGLVQGMSVSPDTGCDWGFTGGLLAGQQVTDLVVRPDNPDVVLGLTGTWLSDAGIVDGGLSYYSQIFESTDDAAHFAPLGLALDPRVLVTTIEVAKSDPNRIYVSGLRGTGGSRTASLFVSTDNATTWAERSIPFLPTAESGVYIGAVDPTNADLVYLRTDGDSRLLVTADAGMTFQVASFTGAVGGTLNALNGYMLGFALSDDGSKIYAGDVEDGVFVGARGALSLARQSSIHVQCLTAHGSELWACSDEASGFVVGVSADDGVTFAPKFHLAGLDGVLQCEPDAGTAQCEVQYPALCQRLDGCEDEEAGADGGAGPGGDAGVGRVDGGATDAANAPAPSSSGCSARGGGGSTGLVALVAAIVGGLLASLRRRRRP
jgi:hypothetical protein